MGKGLKLARSSSFERGVRLGQLERLQASAVPTLRGRYVLRSAWVTVMVILWVAPIGAVCAPFSEDGGTGTGLYRSVDALDSGLMTFLMRLCLALGVVGQLASLADWASHGRRRDSNYSAASFGAVVAGALVLWWQSAQADSDPLTRAGAIACVVAGALVLVVVLVGSRPGSVTDERYRQQAERLQQLPEHEQRAILDERAQILQVLVERDLITRDVADQASKVPLGDLWTLDATPKKG